MNERKLHKVTKSDGKAEQDSSERLSESGREIQPRKETSKSNRQNFARKHRSLMDRIEIRPGDIHRYRGF